jgi:hypothetical protein
MVILLLPDDDWDEVSPSKWDGKSTVRHNGKVVFTFPQKPQGPVGPQVSTFQQEFNRLNDAANSAAVKRFMDKQQKREFRKKLLLGGGVAIGLIAIFVPIVLYGMR